jgi:mannose-6-phosphate isomerase-like protein (cupin superfamily)
MKTTVSIISIVLGTLLSQAQHVFDLNERIPLEWKDNVTVEALTSDSLVSSFMIWIESGVAAHFHASHTEHVYIIEGHGKMQIGENEFEVHPGQLVFIPKGTVHSVEVTSDEAMKALSIQAPRFVGQDRVLIRPNQSSK